MLFWTIFLPGVAISFILYFHFYGRLFNGKKEIYRIERGLHAKIRPFELQLTFTSLFIFACAGLFTGYIISKGWTRLYEIEEYSIPSVLYGFASLFLALFIQDLYFYWSHRFLHLKRVFKEIHHLHHRSHDPNPWSAFSFHPVEAFIQISIVPVVAFILPIPTAVFTFFSGYLIFMSVYGHSGYELRSDRVKVLNVFNTSLHHFQHHRFIRCNYGFYMNLWDKLFRTNHLTYDEAFEQLRVRIVREKEHATQSSREQETIS